MFADSHLKLHFSFTRDSYKGFLLRHGSFSYVVYLQNLCHLIEEQFYIEIQTIFNSHRASLLFGKISNKLRLQFNAKQSSTTKLQLSSVTYMRIGNTRLLIHFDHKSESNNILGNHWLPMYPIYFNLSRKEQQLVCYLKSHAVWLGRICLRCDQLAGLCMLPAWGFWNCMVVLHGFRQIRPSQTAWDLLPTHLILLSHFS